MGIVASYGLYDEDLAVQAILVLGEALTGLTDELGNTYSVPMTARFRDDLSQLPEVIVSCELGDDVMGMAFGQADVDPSGFPIYLARHPQSILTLTIRARSDAERRYLAGTLRSALRFGYISAAPTKPGVYEAAMRQQLAAAGIYIDRVYKTTYPNPDLAAARQDGLAWEANIRIDATVEISVVADMSTVVIPTTMTMNQTFDTTFYDLNGVPLSQPGVTATVTP